MLQRLRAAMKRLEAFLEDVRRIREALERLSPPTDPRYSRRSSFLR